MKTIKFGAIIVMLCLTILFSEVLVFASELPDFKLPEMKPLDTPELSKDYNKMLEELKKEGLDNYKYGVDKEDLIAPDVETPEGTGKKAFEKFKERYGDMWNDPNRQLDRSSTIPDDEFFKAVRDFGKANEQNFGNISKADREAMSNLLKGKLDTSFLRDMKLEKERASKKLLNTKGYLAGTKKPAGWDSVKQQSYVVKKPSLPADQVKRSKSILNKSMMELVWDSIKRSVGDTVSNIKGTYDDLKKIEQILNNKNALSDNDLLKYRESIKNYSKSLLPFVRGAFDDLKKIEQIQNNKNALSDNDLLKNRGSIKNYSKSLLPLIRGAFDDLKKIEQILDNKNALSDNDLLKNRESIKNYSKSLLPFVLPFVR